MASQPRPEGQTRSQAKRKEERCKGLEAGESLFLGTASGSGWNGGETAGQETEPKRHTGHMMGLTCVVKERIRTTANHWEVFNYGGIQSDLWEKIWKEMTLEAGGQRGDCHSALDERQPWPEQVW